MTREEFEAAVIKHGPYWLDSLPRGLGILMQQLIWSNWAAAGFKDTELGV